MSHSELGNKAEESMKKNSELYLCSLFVNVPICMNLITWAQDITQQNVTPPNTAWQKIAKVGKRQVTAWGFCATEYCTFYLIVVLVRQKAAPFFKKSL